MLSRPPPDHSDAPSKKPSDRDSATSAALKCAYSLMQQRIISNPNDMLGILLFGTERSKFPSAEGRGADGGDAQRKDEYPNCYLLADLDVPAAADVKRLRAMVSESSEDEEDEESEAKTILVPSTEPTSMSTVLFCANQIFTTRAPNFSSRRLFLVTDNDTPHATDTTLRQSSIIRAKDLYDLGVTIELFPISQPDHDFNTATFYDDIVYRLPSDPEAPTPPIKPTQPSRKSKNSSGISLLTSLLTSIHSKSTPKRTLFSNLPLALSPSLTISVKGYILHKRQTPKRSCYIWLNGSTPELAVGSTSQRTPDTQSRVDPADVRRAYRFGGSSVTFSTEEAEGLRNFGDPVIRIVGFKPTNTLPLWASTRPSTFIYPSEESYIGSTRTFSALQQTLLHRGKYALVWYIPRKNAAPTLAALLPGSERLGEQQEQLQPPGLWISPLPFADDIRANPPLSSIQQSIKAPDVLMDKLRPVLEKLYLPRGEYDPARYPNPGLQWHYRILQALALDEDVPVRPEDRTVPRYRQIHGRVGEAVVEWGVCLQECFERWQRENGAGGKRVAEGSLPVAKKVKTETADQGGAALTDVVESHFRASTLHRLNVQDLRAWLRGRELPVTGRKDDLLGRVRGWFEG